MNHILKKVIQCVVSIFYVLGMVSTIGKSIKAEGGSIYCSNGFSGYGSSYDFPNGWTKKNNEMTGEGTLFFGYSSIGNEKIETTDLETISESEISLMNSNDEDVKSFAIINSSENYVGINFDNMSVGEYTLTIKDSSLKIKTEKSFAILEDSEKKQTLSSRSGNAQLYAGTKYTLKKVYKDTVSGEIIYTVSDVSDNNGYLNIVNDGLYTIEPKTEYENQWSNLL